MITIQFLAILMTVGFFAKQSVDQKIRTRNASRLRTFIYGVLSFFLIVFYIKTNEVPVIKHNIEIPGIKVAVNDSGEIMDRASVSIVSRFAGNELVDLLKKNTDSVSFHDKEKTQKYGGVRVGLSLYLGSDSLTRFDTIPRNKRFLYNTIIKPSKHRYNVQVVSSRVSSISPFIDKYKMSGSYVKNSDPSSADYYNMASSLSEIEEYGSFEDDNIYDYFDKNSLVFLRYMWTKEEANMPYDYEVPIMTKSMNTMNVFSAADLSQCTYIVSIMSDCPLNKVYFNFDVPVELLPSKCKPDQADAYDIIFKDSLTLERIRNHIMVLHFKMPTMQNVQLVRSLILTTLLSAMLSLFALNFYYLCRKEMNRCRIRRPRLGFQKVWKIKKYWVPSVQRFTAWLFVLLLCLTVMRCCEFYIKVNADLIDYFNYGSLIAAALIVIYYILYLRRIIKSDSVNNSNGEESNSAYLDYIKSIEEKKRQDDEDTQRLFDEQIDVELETEEENNIEEDNLEDNNNK